MAFPLLLDKQLVLPSAAAGVPVAGSGSSWGGGTWVTVTAALAADSILTGCLATTTVELFLETGIEIDIGIGSAGNEVVIATFRQNYRLVGNPPGNSGLIWMPSVLGIDAMPAGSRVAARVRWGTTNGGSWRVAITCYAKPMTGTLETTAAVLKATPTAAASLSSAAGSPAWADGNWTEVRAASGSAWKLVAMTFYRLTGGVTVEVDIGTGTAGAEQVLATRRLYASNMGNMIGMRIPFWNPHLIPAATRLAVRTRCSTASVVSSLAFNYFEA